jgi:hypothetical protein
LTLLSGSRLPTLDAVQGGGQHHREGQVRLVMIGQRSSSIDLSLPAV